MDVPIADWTRSDWYVTQGFVCASTHGFESSEDFATDAEMKLI